MVRHKKVNKEKKKSSSSHFIIALVVIVVIVLASALFIYKPGVDSTPSYKQSDYEIYHGFKFEQRGEFWITFVELDNVPYEAPFYNHPLDLSHVAYDEEVTSFVLEEPHSEFIIAVSDHVGATPVLAGANIARITGKLYGTPTSSALFAMPQERDENQTAIPYVDCSDATKTAPIFWINVNDESQSIYRDADNPYCIIIGGTNDEEILESADLFAYKILQIE